MPTVKRRRPRVSPAEDPPPVRRLGQDRLLGGAIALALGGIIAGIVVPNLICTGHDARVAIEALERISTAQQRYRHELGRPAYARQLATLAKAGLLDAELAAGRVEGYCLELYTPGAGETWMATARVDEVAPVAPRSFAVNHFGVVCTREGEFPHTASCAFPEDAEAVSAARSAP